jgi:hypothetical protein
MARQILKLSPLKTVMPAPATTAHSKPGYTPAPVPRELNDMDSTQTGGNFELPEISTGPGQPRLGLAVDFDK